MTDETTNDAMKKTEQEQGELAKKAIKESKKAEEAKKRSENQ